MAEATPTITRNTLEDTGETIRVLTDEVYPTIDHNNPEDVESYDELLTAAQEANTTAYRASTINRLGEISTIEVAALGDQSASEAMENARKEFAEREAAAQEEAMKRRQQQLEDAANSIHESAESAYDGASRA